MFNNKELNELRKQIKSIANEVYGPKEDSVSAFSFWKSFTFSWEPETLKGRVDNLQERVDNLDNKVDQRIGTLEHKFNMLLNHFGIEHFKQTVEENGQTRINQGYRHRKASRKRK